MKLCRDLKFILLESQIPIFVLLYFQSFPWSSCVHLFDRLRRENWITRGSTLKTSIFFLFLGDHFRRFCFRMFLFLVYIFYDWFNRLSRENWITLGSSLKTFNIWFLFLVIIFDASALECFFSCLHILWFIWSDWYSFQNLHFLHHTRRCICMMSSKEKCVAIKM